VREAFERTAADAAAVAEEAAVEAAARAAAAASDDDLAAADRGGGGASGGSSGGGGPGGDIVTALVRERPLARTLLLRAVACDTPPTVARGPVRRRAATNDPTPRLARRLLEGLE